MKPESAYLNLVDTTANQFPGIGEAFYRRFTEFTHGAPWALYTAQGPSDGNESAPSLDRLTIADTFQLVGSSVSNAIKLYPSYSGVPFGIIKCQLANCPKSPNAKWKNKSGDSKAARNSDTLGQGDHDT